MLCNMKCKLYTSLKYLFYQKFALTFRSDCTIDLKINNHSLKLVICYFPCAKTQ